MQVQKALELKKNWSNKPCDHPNLTKEFDKGAATGDYVCIICGESRWGNTWNHSESTAKKLET